MLIETIAVLAVWKAKRAISRRVRTVVTEAAAEVAGPTTAKMIGLGAGIANSVMLGNVGGVLEGLAALSDASDAADALTT